MSDDVPFVPRLPEHPELREIARAMEQSGIVAELLDSSFRCVFISSEATKVLGLIAGFGPQIARRGPATVGLGDSSMSAGRRGRKLFGMGRVAGRGARGDLTLTG